MKLAEALALQAAAKKKGRDKYKAQRTKLDGLVFASKGEAGRFAVLQLRQKVGEIRNLTTQVLYTIKVNGVHICTYTADFEYDEVQQKLDLGNTAAIIQWRHVVEDFKSNGTKRQRDWPRTKKLMLACHGITIFESGI